MILFIEIVSSSHIRYERIILHYVIVKVLRINILEHFELLIGTRLLSCQTYECFYVQQWLILA